LINLSKLNRLKVSNKEMLYPIFIYNIDFKINRVIFKVLNKGIIYKKAIHLLPFKGGI
jgi:hypothetical protein